MKLPSVKISKKAGIIVLSAALIVVALGGTSAYAASTDALPGSTLYPFKRVWENASLLLALSPASKSKAHLNIASNRVHAAQVTTQPTTVVLPALQEAQQQLNTALDQSSKVTDPSTRKDIKDGVSKEAADAKAELEHRSESESSGDKQDVKSTSDQLQQIQNKASTDD